MVSRGGRARQLTHGPLSLPGHTGVGGVWRMITRVPPGTWETLSFPSSQAAGDTAYQLQIDPRLRVRGRGDEPRTQRWYRQAKETKRGEMGGRESQHLRVPLKRGNQPEGPRRGKEVPSHEPLKGNMPGTLRPEPCPRNDDGSRGSRIHEMRNRVRVMCKPGSVGGLGGRPPRSTRPGFPPLPSREGAPGGLDRASGFPFPL